MKISWINLSLSALLVSTAVSSCSYTSSGNYLGTMAGAEIGGVVGEALGWMSTDRHSGPGRAMMGSIIGTVAGAAIGNSLTKDRAREYPEEVNIGRRNDRKYNSQGNDIGYQTGGGYDNSGRERDSYGDYGSYGNRNDNNSNGNRSDYGSYGNRNGFSFSTSDLAISHVTFEDEDGDGRISRNETINIIYEISNKGHRTYDDVVLKVDVEENEVRRFALSPSTTVSIAPGKSVRYKAKAFCKSKPTDGNVIFRVSASSMTGGNTSADLQIRMSKK